MTFSRLHALGAESTGTYYTAVLRQMTYSLAQRLFDARTGERRLTGLIAVILAGVNGPEYA